MDPVAETRPLVRPRFRRWMIVAGVLVALLLVHTTWDYFEARALKKAIATYAPDYGTAPPPNPIPADRDAAPYYAAAAVLAIRTGEHVSGFDTSRREKWIDGEVPPEMLERIGQMLSSRADALYLVDQATAREFGGFRPGGLPVNLFELLLAKRLVSARALYAATQGDAALATRSLVAQLKMEGAERSPITALTLRTWLLSWRSVTVQDLQFVLSRVAPDTDSLQQLAEAFAAADEDTQLTRFFLLARERWIDSYLNRIGQVDDSFGSAGVLAGGSGLTIYRRIMRPLLARNLRVKLEAYARILEASQAPWPERLDRIVAASAPAGTFDHYLASLAGFPGDPGWIEDAEPWWRLQQLRIAAADLAGVRAARVTVAIERYRRAHDGVLPGSLTDLTPALLNAIPIDPFSGQPLRFASDTTGYVVYSVGPNGTDDRGAEAGSQVVLQNQRRGPEARMTGDIGVRIRTTRK